MPKKPGYIWQAAEWPELRFDLAAAGPALLRARATQGRVKGMAQAIGLPDMQQIEQELWTGEAMATAAIEGEKLELASVRSSVLRHMGQHSTGPEIEQIEGLVDVMQDATEGFATALDTDRLCRWQSALFPGGTAGTRRIAVGRYRDHQDPMQIVSGPPGKEVVHYTAPRSSQVPSEMAVFLAWFESTRPGPASSIDGLARAGIAHLWFETIHPFEDGNGRIGRAIADMALAQDLGETARLYSLSRQMLADRAAYYDALAAAQAGSVDVSAFVIWFAATFEKACLRSIAVMEAALEKSRFWTRHAQQNFNERQRRLIQRLLDAGDGGFLGGLNVEKYLKMTGTSKATATRDLSDLLQGGVLYARGKGKALRYYLSVQGWEHGQAPPEHSA